MKEGETAIMHVAKAHCHRERYFVQIFSIVNDRDGFEIPRKNETEFLHAALQNAHLTEKEVLIFQEEGVSYLRMEEEVLLTCQM